MTGDAVTLTKENVTAAGAGMYTAEKSGMMLSGAWVYCFIFCAI